MKVAIITDQHFGARKNSKLFHDYFLKFYNDVFFPTLEEYGITTVVDMGDPGGYGIAFNHTAVGDITHAIFRATEVYKEKTTFNSIRKKIMSLDFSWGKSADDYLSLYKSFV